jgi:HD-GYP domain-containing protein (c-di-GMP phosphodiesterase class II)
MGATLGAIHMAWVEIESMQQIDRAQVLAANISHWIAPDIAISRVASEMERGYVSAIAAVCASLDDQSDYTSGHGHRVAKVALEIAELLVLSDHDQRQLLYVAEMHDLGKVGVDHEILAKPTALNDEEWTQMQTIPARGAGIVDPVSYFGEVGDAIRHLRERWDGEGYPNALSGEEIPLLARIVAVAEAFDAMTSARPYREAMSSTDALRQLWRERGNKFDPAIVEAFVMARAPRATARV